ncbi:MAG TPA: hypothetical protein VFC78_05375 [Tepidisphaeraceae bacterium]|nr:hypothetical protein [Tepidisphaeraceae bacterium]
MSVGTATRTDDILILSRAIDPKNGNWPAETARGILSLALSKADRDRMNELAAKARGASLTASEEMEIETYRRVTDFLDIMKAKARASLSRDAMIS